MFEQCVAHAELQYLPADSATGGFGALPRELYLYNEQLREYTDTYYDTQYLDLHCSSMLVRTRERAGKLDFLDFKAGGEYVDISPFVYRKFATEVIASADEASDRLTGRTPSSPLRALYRYRVDLLGRILSPSVAVNVRKSTFDVAITSGSDPVARLSVHHYNYVTRTNLKKDNLIILELQPPHNAEPDVKSAITVATALDQAGFRRSPSTKYHRISREDLE